MIEHGPTTSIDSLEALLSTNAELHLTILKLQEEIVLRDDAISDLQSKLNRYWDFHGDVDYRSLVDRIREDARNVEEVLRALDTRTRRTLALLGPGSDRVSGGTGESNLRLLPSVHSLLRTLNEWKQ